MARRKLLVRRKSFVKDVKPGPGVQRKRIAATSFLIEDRGRPGRGPETIEIQREGFMTSFARRQGILDGRKITELPDSQIERLALAMAKSIGPAKAQRMFQAQISFRARAKGAALADRRKFEVGKEAIQRRFFPKS